MRNEQRNGVSPVFLFQALAGGQLGQELYRPEEVWPYLRQSPRPAAQQPERAVLAELCRWVADKVEYVRDPDRWSRPERWQSPSEALWQGAGDCQEIALVLWSAAPLWGLPRGQLVIGHLRGYTHAWVEFPELDCYAEATSGHADELRRLPEFYEPCLRVYPYLRSRSTSRLAFRPGTPVTPPPGCVPAPQR